MAVLGAIAQGVGSLISGISQAKAQRDANKTNLEIARQNNETAINIARENNQFAREHAIEMFNLENAYNDPSKQVERLTAAGLNPAAMMETAGGTAVGNSSGSGMVSPSMPSLTTPHVEAVPPMAVGFLDALNSLSQIKLTNAQARKAGAETTGIEQRLPAELDNLFADARNKEAQAAYTEVLRSIENTYGRTERGVRIQKLVADYSLAVLQGESEKASKLLKEAEAALVNTKNVNEQAQAPIIIENLRKTGRSIDASAAASRAAARYSDAAAGNQRAQARLTNLNADEQELILEVIPNRIVQDLTLKDIEIISGILSSGRAKTVPELVDMIVSKGGRHDAAKVIGDLKGEELLKLQNKLREIKGNR